MKIKQIKLPEQGESYFKTGNWSENLLPVGFVRQLGIYAQPGVRFRTNESDNSLVINGSGLLSLDLEPAQLASLKMSKEDYENIKENQHPVIIDIIYEEGVE